MRRIHVVIMAVVLSALTGYAATSLFSEDFELQAVGTQPTGAANVRPLGGNTPIEFMKVTTGTTNSAGTGNAVHMLDNSTTNFTALEYHFVASNAPRSLVRVDFNVSWKGGGAASTNYANLGFGNYDDDLSLNAKANRWNELRLYDYGMISFDAGSSQASLAPANSAHTVTMIANDLPNPVNYIFNGATNYLNGDSIACWLDGTLTAGPAPKLDIGDTNSITGLTIGNSTNNFGKFGFSTGTSATNLSYVFDDIEFSTVDTMPVPPVPLPPPLWLLNVDFEWDIPGSKTGTTPITLQRPIINTADSFIMVVNSASNPAGSGNGIQLYDNSAASTHISTLEYNWDGIISKAGHVSAVRVDFDFAYVTINTNVEPHKPLHFGLCEYDPIRSSFSSSKRFTDCRFYPDGTIDFCRNAPPNIPTNDARVIHMNTYPESLDNPILPGANSLTMFVNDHDTEFIDYRGPDWKVYSLPTNSVAYWLNDELVMMMDDDETNAYITMDLYDFNTDFPPKNISQSEDNLGKIAWNSETSATNINFVFDNIFVTTNLLYIRYPDYTADPDHDGMNNLLEFALGGNPNVSDAASVLPKWHTSVEGGTNWLNYVYNRRVYRAQIGLTYEVLSGTTLTSALHTATEEAGVGVEIAEMESVTNRVPTDALDAQFMQLKVELY